MSALRRTVVVVIERDGFPPGVPCWVDTAQPDPPAARFYGSLFGWEFEDRMPVGSPDRYMVARLHGADVAAIGSLPVGAPPAAMWNTYVWVENADAAAIAVGVAGGSVLVEPFDVLDAGRMAVFSDRAGAVFNVWQARAHRGAQIVNAPGTWNWSDLNTRDAAGAAAFYGAVFGWAAETVDMGFGEGTMWRLPGYGDFLAARDPDLRDHHTQEGVPPGFSDAIGWMLAMTPDRFPDDGPAHWSVTFAVDDTDGSAQRAATLGGTVVVAPFDAGPVRAAVLTDPYGATFTVSCYQPG